MAWVESVSPSFHARHDDVDGDDAARVLDQLERDRERLAGLFAHAPGELTVVLHDGPTALALAQPYLLVTRSLTAPAGRRYQAGCFGTSEIHVLAPRALEERASGAEGSRVVRRHLSEVPHL